MKNVELTDRSSEKQADNNSFIGLCLKGFNI